VRFGGSAYKREIKIREALTAVQHRFSPKLFIKVTKDRVATKIAVMPADLILPMDG